MSIQTRLDRVEKKLARQPEDTDPTELAWEQAPPGFEPRLIGIGSRRALLAAPPTMNADEWQAAARAGSGDRRDDAVTDSTSPDDSMF